MTTTLSPPTDAPASTTPQHWGIVALRLPDDWLLTDELLEQICQLNPEWRLERGHYGELVVNMGSGGPSFMIVSKLLVAVAGWAATNRAEAFGADASFNVIDPQGGTPMRNPDISLATAAQMESIGGFPPLRGFWPICPAFVVEVRSPGDTLRNQQGRMGDWLRFGAELGWLVDPQNRDVWIYRPEQEPEQLREPSVVEGEASLVGFSMDFAPIWKLMDDAEANAANTD